MHVTLNDIPDEKDKARMFGEPGYQQNIKNKLGNIMLAKGALRAFAQVAPFQYSVFTAKAAENFLDNKVKQAVQLGTPFRDNAIFQQQIPLPIWGDCESWSKIDGYVRQ